MCGPNCDLLLTGMSKNEIFEVENQNHKLVIPPVLELDISNK